jgi:hypothetical protein
MTIETAAVPDQPVAGLGVDVLPEPGIHHLADEALPRRLVGYSPAGLTPEDQPHRHRVQGTPAAHAALEVRLAVLLAVVAVLVLFLESFFVDVRMRMGGAVIVLMFMLVLDVLMVMARMRVGVGLAVVVVLVGVRLIVIVLVHPSDLLLVAPDCREPSCSGSGAEARIAANPTRLQ